MDPGRLQQHLEAVANAFAGVPRPQITKRVARALDDEWFPDEARCRELASMDKETDWRELSEGELQEFADTLSWMSPEAVLFYYPAFLCHALRHWEKHDRVHMEVMEAPGFEPRMFDDFGAGQKRLVHDILSELVQTPEGADYNYWPTLIALRGSGG